MISSARERALVTALLLFMSAAAWVMLFAHHGSVTSHGHAAHAGHAAHMGAAPMSLEMALKATPISSLAAGWALMLVAMMVPTLIAPIHHVRDRSFRRRQLWSVVIFLASYAAIWMAAGGVLLTLKVALSLLVPQSYLPAIVVGLIALVWQCSPIKQICLNRGHNHSELAAFGFAADLSVLHFGVSHGIWCVGSCWALMLFPSLLDHGHFVAMVAVTFLMISERLEQPRAPSWRWRGPSKLLRIIVAQSRIRLKRLLSVSTLQ